MSKTLEEFKKLNGWPESIDRFAYEASLVEDCSLLKEAGSYFLDAEQALLDIMKEHEVELG